MEEIAQLLKETRVESEIGLEEVSKDLNIEEIALKNIEEGKIGSFKDIFILKEYIASYSKYLGLDSTKILNEFNDYLFEYTSKIPIDEIEKTIREQNKEETEISSPYTMKKQTSKKTTYILIYIIVLILVILAIIWSINQIAINYGL